MYGNYSPKNAVTQSPGKGIKQKVEHGIPCYVEDPKKQYTCTVLRDSAIITWRGVGKLEVGHRRK